MTPTVGLWRPWAAEEVEDMKHVAGQFGAGLIEVWDRDQLRALLGQYQLPLVSVTPDTHALPLSRFSHPSRGFYLSPPVGGSIPHEVLDLGRVVTVETLNPHPLNPAVAAAIVLRDRHVQTATREEAA